MCIIIDTNTFSSVFDKSSDTHNQFKPVLDWILFGNGKAVYGGTKYNNELKKAKRYLKIFKILKDARKTIYIDSAKVDEYEIGLKLKLQHRDFDDPHIIAISSVSKCILICSCDSRSYPFLKDQTLYPKNHAKPKIYKNSKNKNLLNDSNIPDIYKPSTKLNKKASENILINLQNII